MTHTKKPKPIERIINKGSAQALRCVEIAMGSPLTEKEKNATKKLNLTVVFSIAKSTMSPLVVGRQLSN